MLWFVFAMALSALALYLVASLLLKLATHLNRHRAASGQPPADSVTTAQ